MYGHAAAFAMIENGSRCILPAGSGAGLRIAPERQRTGSLRMRQRASCMIGAAGTGPHAATADFGLFQCLLQSIMGLNYKRPPAALRQQFFSDGGRIP